LTPLLGGHRRKIELLNSLLMSLPGTPVIYYGDEIGMGDNIYLGDRNGVRTPMQWSPDRNAGFSEANPQQLYLPVILDHEYHYEAVNVETSRRNPYSLFWWMKRLIAMRQHSQIFARGSLRFLLPDNSRVLAFVRTLGQQSILVVANLSRFAQFVELDLSDFRGCHPTELFGRTQFPRIGDLPYLLTLGPHGFFWFAIQSTGEGELQPGKPQLTLARSAEELRQLHVAGNWHRILERRARESLEKSLPDVLVQRRWFGGKAKLIRGVTITDVIPLDDDTRSVSARMLVLRVDYVDDVPESYLLPLGFVTGERASQMIQDHSPALVAALEVSAGHEVSSGVLVDVFGEDAFCQLLLDMIAGRRRAPGRGGKLAGHPLRMFRKLRGDADSPLPVRATRVEQSNSTVFYGDRLLLKLFRRLDQGINPDLELGQYLTEEVHFPHTAQVAGSLDYHDGSDQLCTVGILLEHVRNEGDAWAYTLAQVDQFFDRVLTARRRSPPPDSEFFPADLIAAAAIDPSPLARDLCGAYLESASLLGRRTAELHLALASASENRDFAPEPFTELYQRSLYQGMRGLTRRTLRLLRTRIIHLPEELQADARLLLAREQEIMERFRRIVGQKMSGDRIRCHGDFHLGQVLFTGKDFVIIDFEGEPQKRLSERRLKRSPLRDVAGMIRSFDYASQMVLNHVAEIVQRDELPVFQQWARFWWRSISARFLAAYLTALGDASFAPRDASERHVLLQVFLLEKAMYELGYELNNRPTWVGVPLSGILRALESTG
jgi:maltose alpha-D-glucosyltransferase/alpha-amylase